MKWWDVFGLNSMLVRADQLEDQGQDYEAEQLRLAVLGPTCPYAYLGCYETSGTMIDLDVLSSPVASGLWYMHRVKKMPHLCELYWDEDGANEFAALVDKFEAYLAGDSHFYNTYLPAPITEDGQPWYGLTGQEPYSTGLAACDYEVVGWDGLPMEKCDDISELCQ